MWHFGGEFLYYAALLRLCDLSIRDLNANPTRINKVFFFLCFCCPCSKESVGERKEWLAQSFVVRMYY